MEFHKVSAEALTLVCEYKGILHKNLHLWQYYYLLSFYFWTFPKNILHRKGEKNKCANQPFLQQEM